MPKVGRKRFPYTAKGEAAAKKEAKATGKPLQHRDMPGGPMHTEKMVKPAGKKQSKKKGY